MATDAASPAASPVPTLQSLGRELREVRAQLAITQSALADLAVAAARREADPEMHLARWASRVLGHAHKAVEGTRALTVLPGIERMVRWAEERLSAEPRKPASATAARPA